MVKQIAFFIEGEENPKDTRDEMKLRKTFQKVFGELGSLANSKGLKLQFRLYESRRATFEKFCNAFEDGEEDIYPVLLVDSEDPVECDNLLAEPRRCWDHLKDRAADQWERPTGAEDEQCQLMVQAIEAWLFADPDALAEFYGNRGFRKNSLPRRKNVEQIPKAEHLPSLEAATKDTSKGRYHKVKHLSPLLFRLNMKKVRERAPFCDRIFTTLAARIESFS